MPKKFTKEIFIQKSIAVHGDLYDYSDVEYVGSKVKVDIICPKHGVFSILPSMHLQGHGCPACGREHGKEKYAKTMIDRYGVDNPMKVPSFFDKARNTCTDKYGHAWAMSNSEVRTKMEETNLDKYGAEYPLQNASISDRMQNTVLQRYGVKNVGSNPDIREKMRETCLSRYGSEEPLSANEIRDKIRITNQERYGGAAPMSDQDVRDKSRRTCLQRYGVEHPSQVQDIVDKINLTKSTNGTFGTSSSEETLYEWLCSIFGKDDVLRQHSSDLYPFLCDFYICSRDLYIELNAHWSHGGHWFSDGEYDSTIVDTWRKKDTKYYRNAVHVWCEADVQKRDCARKNGLNYVVFWDTDLYDARLWIQLNCPDGHDYDCSYSWIPYHAIKDSPVLHDKPKTKRFSSIAKAYQFSVFYGREISMWNDNVLYHGFPVQAWLYLNRFRYLNKLPNELSDIELMRGFTIAGILKGFTAFDTKLMDQFIKKYGIRSVYDPCAGWGERMLYCHSNGIQYFGVDVNSSLSVGYDRMMEDFDMQNQSIVFADSSAFDPSFSVDAVFTCPPYGNLEVYSDLGSENMDESNFLQWWSRVISRCVNAHIKYFCFQINQRWKQKMMQVLIDQGFCFVEEMKGSGKSGHFTRKDGVNRKTEFESVLVFSYSS